MTTYALQSDTGSFTGGSQSAALTISTNYAVASDCQLTHIRWKRIGLGTEYKPTRLRVYDYAAGTLVHEAATVPDDFAVGWQDYTLATPASLPAGSYKVEAYWSATGAVIASAGRSAPTAWPSGFGFAATKRCYHYGGTVVDGGQTCDSGDWYALDIGVDAGAPPPPADTDQISYAQLRDEEIRWLSSSGTLNTHQTDLPWLTKAGVDALGTAVAAVKTVTDKLNAISTATITNLNNLSSAAVTRLNNLSDGAVTTLNNLSASLVSILNDIAGVRSDTAPLRDGSGFPSSPWSLVDETDFTGQIAWPVAADRYVLHLTGPNGAPPTDVDGAQWYPRMGWWAILDGTHVSAREFWEFEWNTLEQGGRRMPGVLVKINDGLATGHIQAWMLT